MKELCKVADGMMSDRWMADVTIFEEDVLGLICGYAVQCRKSFEEK